MPDWNRLWLSAQRCAAAYLPGESDARAAFAQLGSTVFGRYVDDDHQVIAHRTAAGELTITLAGTRVSVEKILECVGDLRDDMECEPLDLGDGIKVATGAHRGLATVFAWALGFFSGNPGQISVEGHSLGGQRACYTPLYLPAERIGRMMAFEPPKPANGAYWARYVDLLPSLTTVVHGKDPWFAWDWGGATLMHPPGHSLLWLRDGSSAEVSQDEWSAATGLPEINLARHGGDHDIGAVAAALGALARAQAA